MHRQPWENPQANRIVAPAPYAEKVYAIVLPTFDELPSTEGPSTTQTNQEQGPSEESSLGGIFLVLVGLSAMLGMCLLFGGQPSIAPTLATAKVPLRGVVEGPQLAQMIITAEPNTAKIQVAAVSLGDTLTQTGSLTIQALAGEALAITVSLEGYQTVQWGASATEGVQVIRLVPSQAPKGLLRPKVLATPKEASTLPPKPNERLD
jgi:hypothetical protein